MTIAVQVSGRQCVRRARFVCNADATLILEDRRLDVVDVIDAGLAPEYRYFKLTCADGHTYLVRHDELSNTWELMMFRAGAHPSG